MATGKAQSPLRKVLESISVEAKQISEELPNAPTSNNGSLKGIGHLASEQFCVPANQYCKRIFFMRKEIDLSHAILPPHVEVRVRVLYIPDRFRATERPILRPNSSIVAELNSNRSLRWFCSRCCRVALGFRPWDN